MISYPISSNFSKMIFSVETVAEAATLLKKILAQMFSCEFC